jgi:hypothetical protein
MVASGREHLMRVKKVDREAVSEIRQMSDPNQFVFADEVPDCL